MRNSLIPAILVLAAATTASDAQERQWSLDVSDTDAYLAFGVPETDDIGVSFWCPLHAGEIKLFLPETDAGLKPNAPQDFTLTTGNKWFRFQGKTTANEEAGSISIEGAKPATADVFAYLAKQSSFALTIRKQHIAFPLGDADVTGLIEKCSKP